MDRNYHILYISFEETPEGRSYVGAHSTDDLNDGYLGSFVDKNFSPTSRIIVGYFKSRESLLQAEESLQKVLDVVSDTNYANQSFQHGKGFTYGFLGKSHTDEFRKNVGERNKQREYTPEMREAQSERSRQYWSSAPESYKEEVSTRASNQWKGVPKSEEHKRKIGEAQLGEKNHRYGKRDSPETRAKKSAQSKGRRWANNGIEEKMFKPGQVIPEGWVPGRLKK